MQNRSIDRVAELLRWWYDVTPLLHDDIFITPRGNGCVWQVVPYFAFSVSLPDPAKTRLAKYPDRQFFINDSAELVYMKFFLLLN